MDIIPHMKNTIVLIAIILIAISGFMTHQILSKTYFSLGEYVHSYETQSKWECLHACIGKEYNLYCESEEKNGHLPCKKMCFGKYVATNTMGTCYSSQ
jgi:hypothetical protein